VRRRAATPTATPTPSESILWSFGNGTDGQVPFASVIADTSGNLYGTTQNGGSFTRSNGASFGTVFKLTPPSASGGNWNESILFNFDFVGGSPRGGLIMDASGNLYGTTLGGSSSLDGGRVFELTPPSSSGGNWNALIPWNFCSRSSCADGASPPAGLIVDASGNLYGTTAGGGAYGVGTVFELMPPSSSGGNWNESILWNYCSQSSCADGASPAAGLIMDATGNLYGTTARGGAYSDPSIARGGGGVQADTSLDNRRELGRVNPLELRQRR
jgi:uncharacterized repeat protein (TIGR03803 family)